MTFFMLVRGFHPFVLVLFIFRCHAVAVSDNNLYFYDHIDQELKECGLKVKAREIIDVIDDYVGDGYAKSTEEELCMYASYKHL